MGLIDGVVISGFREDWGRLRLTSIVIAVGVEMIGVVLVARFRLDECKMC